MFRLDTWLSAPTRLQRRSMAKLKWFVIRDMVKTELVRFWRDSAEIERGELKRTRLKPCLFLSCGRTAEKKARSQTLSASAMARATVKPRATPVRRVVHSSTGFEVDRRRASDVDRRTTRALDWCTRNNCEPWKQCRWIVAPDLNLWLGR